MSDRIAETLARAAVYDALAAQVTGDLRDAFRAIAAGQREHASILSVLRLTSKDRK